MPTRDEPVYLRVDGQHILGTLISPGSLIPGVLFVHGWGGDQRQYQGRARQLAGLGCICLTFDLRGHAQTRAQHETVSREEGLRDVLAAYDFLAAQHNVDSQSIAVVGSSYGGYLAALLTSLRPVKWLALRVPALYKDTDWALPKERLKGQQDLAAYRLLPVHPEQSRALQACQAFNGDALIVESERDNVVPHQVIVNYRDAFVNARSVAYRVIAGADHSLSSPACQNAYTTVLIEWLTAMVFGARGSETAPRVGRTLAPSTAPLQSAHEQQHDQDDHDDARNAAGIVAPAAAVGPGRQRTDQYQHKDDEKNGSEGHVVAPSRTTH